MQLHISPSLRHVTVLPGKGVREFIKVNVGGKRVSYRMLFYALLFFTFLLRFVFVLSTVDTIDGETKCSTLGCLGKRLGPRILGRRLDSVPEVIYKVLKEPLGQDDLKGRNDIPQTLDEFMAEVKDSNLDAKTFALKLREMVTLLEQRTRTAKIQEYLYRHVASSSIPKQLHCLALRLANEHSTNAAARLQLPTPELVPALVDNSYFHFVLASDNVLAAAVVANSLVQNALRPQKLVLHIITDRKTYSPMQAWFSLHPLSPAIIEVKALHHFDWFTKGKVPVLEAMEKDQRVRSQFRGGSSAIVANNTEKPVVIAAKLQALSPKYNSVMNHIRIHLPELFPSLNKVVFLDDDIVVQTDLSPLWDIDMNGKVNGAVETCRGKDKFVMSKRFKSYLNFSHPLIASNFNPNECAWAYGMNIFDLGAWRRTNISLTYHYWVEQNLKSDLSLWQLGTLPPGLIAFHGHVRVIDPFWHMLGLGYQDNTSLADAESAGVIHFNGRAKPWLDIAFPQLRPLWANLGAFLGSYLLVAAVVLLYRRYSFNKMEKEFQSKIKSFLDDYMSHKPTRYSYADIKRMTSQFKDELGQGAYGTVFRGKLSDEIIVAIKVLNISKGNGEEFVNEVGTIGKIHHVNVVRLIGFCADGFRRALVYEYLPNDSLQKFISPADDKNHFLGWKRLQDIALGIAKGIEYLHQGCDQRILHFDIKPHNILLDHDFNPKISDFGLAKLCAKDQSAVSMTTARGTIGYIAPEVFSRNFRNVSYKADIYSFGMLVLEMVGGRKIVDITKDSDEQIYFPEWIYYLLEEGEDLRFHIEEEGDAKIAKKLAIIGLWCIQWNPVDRPTIRVVVHMLEGEGENLTIPPNPFNSGIQTKKNPKISGKRLHSELDAISETE